MGLGTTFLDALAIGDTTIWSAGQRQVDASTWIDVTSIFDLSDPATPALVGELPSAIPFGDSRDGLFVGGATTFVTMDVTVPTAPAPLGELAVTGGVKGECLLDGAVAWTGFEAADRSYGVRAIDVSDPAQPFVLGELPFGPDPGSPRGLAIRGDRLYAGCLMYDDISDISTGALFVVDIANAQSPGLVNMIPTPKPILGVAIDGDRLWLILHQNDTYDDRVDVRDLSNPDLPAVLATKVVPYLTTDIDAHAGVAYVASSPGGVHLLTLTDNGVEACGTPSVSGRAQAIRVVGSVLATTFGTGGEWASGLQVFPLAQGPVATELPLPGATAGPTPGLSLHTDGPNPFTTAVRMQVRLPAAAPARVTVHDAAGRLVRTLTDGPMGAGVTPLTWDGRDASGGPVSSGVYFLRLQSAEGYAASKVTRLR